MKELSVKNSQVYLPKYVILLFLSDVSKERDPDFQSEERKLQRILHLIGTRLFPNLNTNLLLLLPLRKMLGEKVNSW